MIPRVLEPEVMDGDADARDYDAMDHSGVNDRFAEDFLVAHGDRPGAVLDVGAGTALIPIAVAGRSRGPVITALDAAPGMVALARRHVADAGLEERVKPLLGNARDLPFPDWHFAAVISNSIVHHVADPEVVLAEMARVCRRGGTIFVRDLLRPESDEELQTLVDTYAANDTPRQRQLFADSLRAALTLDEVRDRVARLGFDPRTVERTSDRHWTWAARSAGCGD